MIVELLVEEKNKLEQKRKDKEQRLSVLEQQIKAQEKVVSIDQRNKRTHRLCVYGGTVEKYLPPGQYSEQKTVQLLEQIFNLPEAQNLIKK